MPIFVSLLKYTRQGVVNIKDSPNRLDAARRAAREYGGDVRAFYLTMGQYDAVVVAEMPDDASMAKFLLASASLGNVSTETLRAFTEEEYRRIIADLP